jgi:hypothetical protein
MAYKEIEIRRKGAKRTRLGMGCQLAQELLKELSFQSVTVCVSALVFGVLDLRRGSIFEY